MGVLCWQKAAGDQTAKLLCWKGLNPLFPLFEGLGKKTHLVTAVTSLFGGAMGSVFIFDTLPTYCHSLLLISWLYTVGGARKLQTTICHYCVHKKFFEDYRDRWLAEVLSIILLTQDFEGYELDHVKLHHHILKFATMLDPDVKFLWILGFRKNLLSQPKTNKANPVSTLAK